MMEGLCVYFFQIPGNKGFFNFMRDPKLAHILVIFYSSLEVTQRVFTVTQIGIPAIGLNP